MLGWFGTKSGNTILKTRFRTVSWPGQVFPAPSKNTLLSIWGLLPAKMKRAKEFIQRKNLFSCFKPFCRIFQNPATSCLTRFPAPEPPPSQPTNSADNLSAPKKIRCTGKNPAPDWPRKPNNYFYSGGVNANRLRKIIF